MSSTLDMLCLMCMQIHAMCDIHHPLWMDWEPTGKWGIILRPLLEIASTTTHDAFALFSST